MFSCVVLKCSFTASTVFFNEFRHPPLSKVLEHQEILDIGREPDQQLINHPEIPEIQKIWR